jgi:hypothetical protein
MKLYLCGVDQLVAHYMKEKFSGEVITSPTMPLESQVQDNLILVTEGVLKPDQINELKEKYPDAEIFYYYNKKGAKNYLIVHGLCEREGIHFIPAHYTHDMILHTIQEAIGQEQERESQIITVHGALPGAGTSLYSEAIAFSIGEQTKQEVKPLYINLNLYNPGRSPKGGKSLDQIKSSLLGGYLTADELKDAVIDKGNYYYLSGNKRLLQALYYQEREIELLLDIATKEFPLVIADLGSIPETAAWLVGIEKSSLRFIVTKQEEHYLETVEEVLRLTKTMNLTREDYLLVLNEYEEHEDLHGKNQIQQYLNMRVVNTIPRIQRLRGQDLTSLVTDPIMEEIHQEVKNFILRPFRLVNEVENKGGEKNWFSWKK